MIREKELKRYSKNFIANFEKHLKAGISITVNIYPVKAPGAILEFKVNKNNNRRIVIHEISKKLGVALSKVEQSSIGGDLSNINFGGTNLILENERIIIIKGDDDQNSWSNRAIIEDIKRIIDPARRTEVK